MNKIIKINEFQNLIDKIHNSKDISFDDIDWRIQKSDKNKVIFVQTGDEKKIIEKYFKNKDVEFSAIVTNNESLFHFLKDFTVIYAKNNNFLELRKIFCDSIYPLNINQKIIGVTGTNGKTSVANYIVQLSRLNNLKSITIGTMGIYDGDKYYDGLALTSPDYIDTRKFLNTNNEKELVIFETSSHSLEQNRFYKINISVGGWTNLTQDHLDYHGTMENYFNAKVKICSLLNGNKLFLLEDMKSYFDKIPYENKKIVETMNYFDNEIKNKNLSLAKSIFEEATNLRVENVENIKDIPGRFNYFVGKKNNYILDFAHTPDALENLLIQVKSSCGHSVLLIFGCGGDRDRSKRILMGKIADQYSDEIILTNDNPRTENELQIIEDIAKGISKKYHVIPDRVRAIEKSNEYEGFIVVVAGKGHENYIEINNVKYPYSDEDEIKKYL